MSIIKILKYLFIQIHKNISENLSATNNVKKNISNFRICTHKKLNFAKNMWTTPIKKLKIK